MNIETQYSNVETSWNESHLINDAINSKGISTEEASEIIYKELLPKIFHTKIFVELPEERLRDMDKTQGEALRDLLDKEYENGSTVLDTLSENNVSLAIAMQEGCDEDPLMVESLQRLNEKDINPTLWLVLDDKLGYWTNKANVEESVEKLERIIVWSKENSIKFDKIGLDYEPPIELLKGLINFNIPSTIKELYKYTEESIENRKKLGNLQKYIDSKLEMIMEKYNVGIETYAAMEPLRSLSNWLTLYPNNDFETVSMTYTHHYHL